MPGSRNGRATPVTTPQKIPFEVQAGFASLMVPWVGATTVNEFTCTRMPSYFSRLFRSLTWVSAAVITCGAGKGLPVDCKVVTGEPAISVCAGLDGSAEGMNS